jgi:hypothetical protein
MILLYSAILLILGVVNFLIARRVKSLEKKFSRVSLATSKLANQPLRPGGSRADMCASAKQQFDLGKLVHQRDRLEAKYYGWQKVSDRMTRWVKGARAWKGRKLPYTFGVIDVSMLLYAVDRFGLGQVDLSHLLQMIQSAVTR